MEIPLQIFIIFQLYNLNTGFILKKCCPDGYIIQENYGYNYANEFKNNNLHCKSDIESSGINWIPKLFQNINNTVIIPNNNEYFSQPCGDYSNNVFNILDQFYENNPYNPVILKNRGYIEDPDIYENGDLNMTVYHASGLVQNLFLYEGSYCLDIDFNFSPVLMTCACSGHNCIQYCCGGHEKIGVLDTNGNFLCRDTTLPMQWDIISEKSRLAPTQMWIPAFAKYWRYRCEHSSHGFIIEDEHEHDGNQELTVLKYHKILQASKFTIEEDASLISADRHHIISSELYCLAPVLEGGKIKTNAFFCEHPEFALSESDVIIHSWFAGIGAVFTLLTLFVHAILPDMRRGIKGVSLMAHCGFMLVAYIGLAIRPYIWSIEGASCLQLAYVLQFSLLAAFFWLNIRAIFIFTRFRSMETMLSRLSNKGDSVWLYPLCALYACAVPAFVCIITYFAQPYSNHASRLIWRDGSDPLVDEDQLEAPSWLLTPDLDDISCWFATPLGRALYFSLPMGIVLLANLFMFISTVYKLIALTRGRTVQSTTDLRSDKKRLFLFAKMFVLMGLTWSGEFLSFANYLSQYYWYFSTVAMTMRAAAIFGLFCCKRKVWDELVIKLKCNCKRDDVSYKQDQMNEFTKDCNTTSNDLNATKESTLPP